MRPVTFLFFVLFIRAGLFSQQVADTTYDPVIRYPLYPKGSGPTVYIDEGHFNFHTMEGRYKPFALVLEKDGYLVKGYTGEFVASRLSDVRILVIANALNRINVDKWYLPTPSAFTPAEIEAVKKWVSGGGSLFLIADHMPMAGAASDLAAVFGFEFSNGFALDTSTRGPSYFSLRDSSLRKSEITAGRNPYENVRRVVTFTGQAFKIPGDATPVLVFNKRYTNFMPDTAWQFEQNTRKFNVKGWSQGAYKTFGKGKVVVFGEAAMFTAQLAGPDKTRVGMNAESAAENYKLLLNIIHWLDGKLN